MYVCMYVCINVCIVGPDGRQGRDRNQHRRSLQSIATQRIHGSHIHIIKKHNHDIHTYIHKCIGSHHRERFHRWFACRYEGTLYRRD